MAPIKPPRHAGPYPDRDLDCAFFLEPEFQNLARRAVEAGWTEAEVARALVQLATDNVAGMEADEATEKAISEARKRSSH